MRALLQAVSQRAAIAAGLPYTLLLLGPPGLQSCLGATAREPLQGCGRVSPSQLLSGSWETQRGSDWCGGPARPRHQDPCCQPARTVDDRPACWPSRHRKSTPRALPLTASSLSNVAAIVRPLPQGSGHATPQPGPASLLASLLSARPLAGKSMQFWPSRWRPLTSSASQSARRRSQHVSGPMPRVS